MKRKIEKVIAIMLLVCMCIINVAEFTVINAAGEDANSIANNRNEQSDDDDFVDVSFEHTFRIQSEWDHHYNAEIALKNITNDVMENWHVAFMYDGEIENIWNAKIVSHDDNVYVIKNVGWNQDINAGESVSFGFTVKYKEEKPGEPYNFDMEKLEHEVVDGCEFTYKQFTKYDNKIQGQIEITNTSDDYIEDWSIIFDANFEIKNIWNGEVSEKGYNYADSDEDQITPIGMHYFVDNANYNQNIEPGQTINLGFIAELISGDDVIIENQSLYQLTVIPDNEDDEVLEEDCIWEGDEVIDEMSLVTDEKLDDDDYDQMKEDDYEQELTSASAKRQSELNEEDAGIQLYAPADDGERESDKISYYIYALPHKKQVQAWCKSGNVIFVAQNDENGNSVISYCEKVSTGKYEYKSEIQISAAGHTQSIYCYKKKLNKYYLLINSHAVNFGEDIQWGTRFSRVIYDMGATGKNKDAKEAQNIMVNTKCDTTKMNLLRTYKEKKLKYFKAIAFARREEAPFAGWSKRKGVAKLKRCDFAISPNKEDMVIWKKSGNNRIEYSVFKWKKVLAMFKEAKGNVTFNSDNMRKLCEFDTFENIDRVEKRSFQGIAIDNSSNIIITSGNNRLQEKQPNKDKYITIFYKKAKKSRENVVGYKNSKEVKLVKPKYNSSTWMKNLIGKQVGISAQDVPALEIEGINVSKSRVYFAVGIPQAKNINNNQLTDKSWKTRTFIFSRNLTDLYD